MSVRKVKKSNSWGYAWKIAINSRDTSSWMSVPQTSSSMEGTVRVKLTFNEIQRKWGWFNLVYVEWRMPFVNVKAGLTKKWSWSENWNIQISNRVARGLRCFFYGKWAGGWELIHHPHGRAEVFEFNVSSKYSTKSYD